MKKSNCNMCNKEFYFYLSKRTGKFCSRKCYLISPEFKIYAGIGGKTHKGKIPKNFKEMQKRGWDKLRGTKQSEEQKRKSGLAVKNSLKFQTAMKSPEFIKKMTLILRRCSRVKGNKHWNWQGGKWSDPEYKKTYIQYNNRVQKLRRKDVVGSFTLNEWEDLKKKFNYMCLCCKQQEPFIKLSVDHIIPIIMGGSNDITNIQPLCLPCNMRKHARIIDYRKNYVN